MQQVGSGVSRHVLAVLVGLLMVVGSAAVLPDRVSAAPAQPDADGGEGDLAEIDPLELDRSQSRLEDALGESGAGADDNRVPLPAGALDGQARPEDGDGEGDDPMVLSPDGDGAAHPPPEPGPENEMEVLDDQVESPPADLDDWTEEDWASPVAEGADHLPPALEGEDPGDLVEMARGIDLEAYEPGDEVEELRTVESQTFVTEDGSLETNLSNEPMFSETPAGDLVELDLTPVGGRDAGMRPPRDRGAECPSGRRRMMRIWRR